MGLRAATLKLLWHLNHCKFSSHFYMLLQVAASSRPWDYLSNPVMECSPCKLVQRSSWDIFVPICPCACYSHITTLELGFQNLSNFLPTLNQGPSGCNNFLWYGRLFISLLSWGGQQQNLINENLNKATVEPQLQIKRIVWSTLAFQWGELPSPCGVEGPCLNKEL